MFHVLESDDIHYMEHALVLTQPKSSYGFSFATIFFCQAQSQPQGQLDGDGYYSQSYCIQPLLGNKGYTFFEKDKDNILVDNILAILFRGYFQTDYPSKDEDILGIFKDQDNDMDFWVICEVHAGSKKFRLFGALGLFIKTLLQLDILNSVHNCRAL